jgi:hypothetical protein
MISAFRRDVDEICVHLRYYAMSSGNPLPTLRNIPEERRSQGLKKFH